MRGGVKWREGKLRVGLEFIRMVCDANILICAAEPGDVVCAPFVESPDAVIASVTRIELPGFPGFCQLAPEPQARFLRQQQKFRWNCGKLC